VVVSPSLPTVVRNIAARKQAAESLRGLCAPLHSLPRALPEAQEAERRRISRAGAHDQVGANLTALGMRLAPLSDPDKPDRAEKRSPSALMLLDESSH